MIQIRKKAAADIPDILTTNGRTATDTLITRYNNGETEFKSADFDSNIYGHADVKTALITAQDGKCCFCESKITHISYGDVEHFRPKAGWVQANEALNKPGYYWLAYDWGNLLLSCQICNQRHKKNYFPLTDTTTRATSHNSNIALETTVFINPSNENPENYIRFNEELPVAIDNNLRAVETIQKLGLDRDILNEYRRQKLSLVRDIYKLAKGYPDTYPALKQQAKQTVEKYFNESQLDSTEYASMLRCFFRENPIDF
jgi:uncharacterized protein (TIGR02646 family)